MTHEVLAPAGSFDALIAAVRGGADAVYLGAGNFNARRNAANFDGDTLREAVAFCHTRGVKVHLALNTLVGDSEIKSALRELKTACKCGIDAVIVQDFGLAMLIRKAAPDIEMHASTQMSIHSPSALVALKELGFSRVVLARELSKSEIADICREAARLGIETEVFVHGALCMCLSGQCYMSGIIGQRSGNRGLCAQPCRLADKSGSYPLSLRDLSLLGHINELKKLGVNSFKIEGRMKRPEYVAAATHAMRLAVDGETVDSALQAQLDGIFSRSGHTDGYFTGRLGADMFGVRTENDVSSSAETLRSIHGLYRSERQSVPVDISLKVSEGEPLMMSITDGEHTVCELGETAETARNLPADSERLRIACAKLGSTPYYLRNFDCNIVGSPAVSASSVNALRRTLCERLDVARQGKPKAYFEPELNKSRPCRNGDSRLIARFENKLQIADDISGLSRVFLPPGSDFSGIDCEIGVEIPRALFAGEDKILEMLIDARQRGAKYALCHNIAAIVLAKKARLCPQLGFGMNVFNSIAADLFKDFDVTLSFELTLGAARSISRGGIVAYGRLPLMITRNCPHGGRRNCADCPRLICDRKGEKMPIICRDGYSEIYNSKRLLLSPERDKTDGFDFLMLYFTDENADEVSRVISHFSGGKPLGGDFTRGLYYRGVM